MLGPRVWIVLIGAAIRNHRNDLAMDYLRRLSLSLGYPTEKEHFLLGNGSPSCPDSKWEEFIHVWGITRRSKASKAN